MSARAAALFVIVALLVAAVGGGWWALGRVDPLLAVPGMMLAAAMAGAAVPRETRWRLPALAAMIVALAVAAVTFAGTVPPLALALAGVGAGAALGLDRLLRRLAWGWRLTGALVLAVFAWQAAAWPLVRAAYRPGADAGGARADLVVMTSLPLFWDAARGQAAQQPVIAALRAVARVTPVDGLRPETLRPGTILLLAHPRALPPATLVLIDDWVRGGGRAIILADGLSTWPPPFAIGDPRNPPVTSLLGPLLDHWGVTLDAPAALAARAETVVDGGRRLTLFSAGRLTSRAPGCIGNASRTVLRCTIGQGRAVIVADADWIDPAQWAGRADDRIGDRSGNRDWLAGMVAAWAGTPSPHRFAAPLWIVRSP